MLYDAGNAVILLTEIKNLNGSLDNSEKLNDYISERLKEGGLDAFEGFFGVVVQDFGTYLKADYTSDKSNHRFTSLEEMFEEDKKLAIEHNRKLSIFLIKLQNLTR